MLLLPKQLLLRLSTLWNFCEVFIVSNMFKFYEVTAETLQWIRKSTCWMRCLCTGQALKVGTDTSVRGS